VIELTRAVIVPSILLTGKKLKVLRGLNLPVYTHTPNHVRTLRLGGKNLGRIKIETPRKNERSITN